MYSGMTEVLCTIALGNEVGNDVQLELAAAISCSAAHMLHNDAAFMSCQLIRANDSFVKHAFSCAYLCKLLQNLSESTARHMLVQTAYCAAIKYVRSGR
eukprot:19654-Heterococcus_DN1.PRE.1